MWKRVTGKLKLYRREKQIPIKYPNIKTKKIIKKKFLLFRKDDNGENHIISEFDDEIEAKEKVKFLNLKIGVEKYYLIEQEMIENIINK